MRSSRSPPLYWIVALSALLFYQDAAGRFLMAPVALAAATWGIACAGRPLAWGLAGIAVTAVALAVLNDSKRPSGVPLLERPRRRATGRSRDGGRRETSCTSPDLIRFVDERVPARRPSRPRDHGERRRLLFFGRGLDRRLDLLGRGSRDAPQATWAFVSPSAGRRSLRGPVRSATDGDPSADRALGAWRSVPGRPERGPGGC